MSSGRTVGSRRRDAGEGFGTQIVGQGHGDSRTGGCSPIPEHKHNAGGTPCSPSPSPHPPDLSGAADALRRRGSTPRREFRNCVARVGASLCITPGGQARRRCLGRYARRRTAIRERDTVPSSLVHQAGASALAARHGGRPASSISTRRWRATGRNSPRPARKGARAHDARTIRSAAPMCAASRKPGPSRL